MQAGDAIVTSGLGGVYPAGLPVGTVSLVERRNNSAFLRVQLEPAARMLSAKHVLVLDPAPQAQTEASAALAQDKRVLSRKGADRAKAGGSAALEGKP